jgi:hypothetical protein
MKVFDKMDNSKNNLAETVGITLDDLDNFFKELLKFKIENINKPESCILEKMSEMADDKKYLKIIFLNSYCDFIGTLDKISLFIEKYKKNYN